MRRASPRRLTAAGVALAAVAAAAALACGGGGTTPQAGGGETPTPPAVERRLPVDLYFPGADGRLHPERRELLASDRPEEQVRTLLAALLAGPEEDGNLPVFAESYGEVEVAAVLFGRDGVVLVDLHGPDGAPPPGGGSRQEIVTVYSLVNSIALNVGAARRVALLWNGNQRPSFAGHVDTSRPLAPDAGLVAR